MQVLYQTETAGKETEEAFRLLKDNFQANKKAVAYAQEILTGVNDSRSEIDGLIVEHSKNWRLERMNVIDRNILRVAVFELLKKKDIPASVVINEAIEVAISYSDEDAPPFINGLLDSMKQKLGRV